MTLCELREVSRRVSDGLRERAILDRVSFELFERETLGVLGARGAGKTTLLRAVAGLEAPEEGAIHWRGRDIARLSADERARLRRRGGIALVCGDWRPSASKVVLEHVAMPLYSDGLGAARAEALAWRALEVVRSPRLGGLATDALSQPDRVRVELARAIVREPTLLLIDEPAVLPRPKEAQELFALIHSLPKALGLALVVASEEVAALRGAGRVMHLDNGRLYSTDSRRTVVELSERRRSGAGAGAS